MCRRQLSDVMCHAVLCCAVLCYGCRSETELPEVLPFTAADLCELMRLDRQPALLQSVQQLMPSEGEGGGSGCTEGSRQLHKQAVLCGTMFPATLYPFPQRLLK